VGREPEEGVLQMSSKRLVTTVVTATFLALGYGGWTAVAQPGEFVDGVLQPLESGFPDRAITIVVVDDPGSRDGIYARSLQEAARGMSPVDILVSDEPAGPHGNFATLADILDREGGKEGYYPVVISIAGPILGLHLDPVEEELGLGLDDFNIILVTESLPYAMIQRKDAPWGKSFAEFVEHAKAHPGEVRYTSNQVGTGTDTSMEWMMSELGITVQKIPQTGGQAAATAVGAGEGDFSMVTGDVALTHYEAGRVDVVLVSGSTVPPPWNEHAEIVSMADAGFPGAPWGTDLGLAVGKEVPQENIDWLAKLFKAASETELHQKRAETYRILTMNYIDAATANELKRRAYEYADPILRQLGMHKDSQ
jgi:tripartite-type tricarboxylate transporter receptor subunit TctC